MNRFYISIFLCLAAVGVSAQKSRVLSVIQMIEQGKYEEGKESIELAVWNDKTAAWARTYFVRGLLCQTAYEDGIKTNDSKKTGLYPDQLYLAYSSYERALELDSRKRHKTAISQQYYLLSNDFRQMGQSCFNDKEFEKALRAFEHALLLDNSPLIHAKVDTSLIFNTALSAVESKNWNKAIGYLTGLHESGFASSSSLLLYQALIESGDSASAEGILLDGLEIYNYETQLVVHLVNLFAQTGRYEEALEVFDKAIRYRPDIYKFYWGQGLIYRRTGDFESAIKSFKAALELAPDEAGIYYHIGVIYYNMGIDLAEESLKVKNSIDYQAIKKESREQYKKAVSWLEQSYEMDPYNEEAISKLYQLYYQLQMKEKEASMKLLID